MPKPGFTTTHRGLLCSALNVTWLTTIVVLLSPPALADAMKCGNRLVTTGDSKAEVLIRCGTPDWRDQWSEALIEDYAGAFERRISVERERWIYNFGPQKFLRFLVFENGKLIEISTGSHGYHKNARPPTACNMDGLSTGLSQYEVLQRCGQPFFKDSRHEDVFSGGHQHRRLVEQHVEEWTYNLGPTRFMRILKFKNGRLEEITTGDKGF